jgi:hypothetical protein
MRLAVRDTSALAVGSAMNGLLAYVFFALATRTLGPVAAASVSVLWTYWNFSAAAITFPVQHWITRSVAAHGGEGAVRRSLPRVVLTIASTGLATSALAWLLRDPLFHRADLGFPLLVGAVTLGSGLSGSVRGGLAARHRFVSLGWALFGENALRCAAAGVLIVLGVREPLGFGLCLIAGPLVSLVWASVLRFSPVQERGGDDSALAFLGGAAGGQLVGQSVLTGGPVVLALSGGAPAQVTALFTGLALFRAPYTLALGLVSQLTGRLTVLVIRGHRATLRRLRLGLVAATAVTVVVAAVIGAELGPTLLRLIFGHAIQLSRGLSALVAVGSALALSNLVLTVAILAQNRGLVVARVWLVSLAAAAVSFALLGSGPLQRTCIAFLVAEAVAWVLALYEEMRGAGMVIATHEAG